MTTLPDPIQPAVAVNDSIAASGPAPKLTINPVNIGSAGHRLGVQLNYADGWESHEMNGATIALLDPSGKSIDVYPTGPEVAWMTSTGGVHKLVVKEPGFADQIQSVNVPASARKPLFIDFDHGSNSHKGDSKLNPLKTLPLLLADHTEIYSIGNVPRVASFGGHDIVWFGQTQQTKFGFAGPHILVTPTATDITLRGMYHSSPLDNTGQPILGSDHKPLGVQMHGGGTNITVFFAVQGFLADGVQDSTNGGYRGILLKQITQETPLSNRGRMVFFEDTRGMTMVDCKGLGSKEEQIVRCTCDTDPKTGKPTTLGISKGMIFRCDLGQIAPSGYKAVVTLREVSEMLIAKTRWANGALSLDPGGSLNTQMGVAPVQTTQTRVVIDGCTADNGYVDAWEGNDQNYLHNTTINAPDTQGFHVTQKTRLCKNWKISKTKVKSGHGFATIIGAKITDVVSQFDDNQFVGPASVPLVKDSSGTPAVAASACTRAVA
jgi:hypothetical protein